MYTLDINYVRLTVYTVTYLNTKELNLNTVDYMFHLHSLDYSPEIGFLCVF